VTIHRLVHIESNPVVFDYKLSGLLAIRGTKCYPNGPRRRVSAAIRDCLSRNLVDD
jgi:hypothetical protein